MTISVCLESLELPPGHFQSWFSYKSSSKKYVLENLPRKHQFISFQNFYEGKNRIHSKSTSITIQHRRKLLDWLFRVNSQFSFQFDTWVLTASLLDRFLSAQPIEKDVFQLAGTYLSLHYYYTHYVSYLNKSRTDHVVIGAKANISSFFQENVKEVGHFLDGDLTKYIS